ncbi:type IV pilus assembly protein PilE [Pseudomonas sp. TE3786]
MQKSERGFTLVELMVTVVILSILAAIAIPSYTRYVTRAHRSEAQALLNEAAAREERYYAQNNAFTSTVTNLGLRSSSGLSDNGYYQLSISTSDDTQGGYLLSATPQGSQAKDTECGTMKLNALGERSVTGSDSSACWK